MSISNTNQVISNEAVSNVGIVNRGVFLGVMLAIVFEFQNPSQFFPVLGALKLNSIIPLFTFTVWFLFDRKNLIAAPQNKLFIALTILVGFSLLNALITYTAYSCLKVFIGYFLLYYTFIHCINSTSRLKKFILLLIVLHLIIASLSTPIFFNPTRSGAMRSGFFLGNGNDFSLSLIIMIPLSVYLYLTENRPMVKFFCAAAIILFITMVVVLSSRASSLALAAIFLTVLLRSKKKFKGIIAITVVSIGILFFASDTYFKRMQTITHYQTDSSAVNRIETWKAGIAMAIKNPLGVGAGNFTSNYGRYYISENSVTRRWLSPHSMYIQALSELGFPGIIMLLALLYYNYRYATYIKNKFINEPKLKEYAILGACLESSLIGFAINAAFLSTLYFPHTFIVTGMIVAAQNITIKSIKPI